MNFKLIILIIISTLHFGFVTSQAGANAPTDANDVAKQLASKGIEKCEANSKLPLFLDASSCTGTCIAKVGQNVSITIGLIPGDCKSLALKAEYSSPHLTGENFFSMAPHDLCTQVSCPTVAGQKIIIAKNEPVLPWVVTQVMFTLKVRICCEKVESWLVAPGPKCATPGSEITCLKLKLTVMPGDAPKMAPLPAIAPFPNFMPPGPPAPIQPAFVGFPGFAPLAQPPNPPAQG